MFDALFGPVSSNSRIHEGATIFMQFVFRSAEDAQLKAAGPTMVAAIVTMLRSMKNRSRVALCHFFFLLTLSYSVTMDHKRLQLVALEAVGLLGERIPAVIANDLSIASDLVEWVTSVQFWVIFSFICLVSRSCLDHSTRRKLPAGL